MASRGNSKARNEIIEMLKQDHQRVKKAFKAGEKLHEEERHDELRELVEQTVAEVRVHAKLEEELFYPAAREAVKEEDLIDEAEVEHQSAKALMEQLDVLSPDDPRYMATFKVLGEYLKHHIREEENELFEQLSGGRSKVQWEELQQQMLTMRETLMAEMGLGEEEAEAAQQQPSQRASARARTGRSSSEQSAEQEETVD
jgi:hypothetical protein